MDEEPWDQMNETFECFGSAAFAANVLEMGLVCLLLFLDFIRRFGSQMIDPNGKVVDPTSFKRELSRYIRTQNAKTMGTLYREVERFQEISPELKSRIRKANKCRNY